MATTPKATQETIIGADSSRWTELLDRLEPVSSWFVVAAFVVLYVMVYAVLLVGAAIVALYLAAALPGVAGAVVFLTIGLTIVAAAPVAARQVLARALEAIERRHEASRGE